LPAPSIHLNFDVSMMPATQASSARSILMSIPR
jgi:hypothetical protein